MLARATGLSDPSENISTSPTAKVRPSFSNRHSAIMILAAFGFAQENPVELLVVTAKD